MSKRPKEYKFTFTYKDIAKIKGISSNAVGTAACKGDFNPNDLGSITKYIYGGMIRELKQTLQFWKDKAKKGEADGQN